MAYNFVLIPCIANDATDLNEAILLLEICMVIETLGKECWEGGPFFTVGQSL